MKDYFDYNEVPKRYLHCKNAACPRSADCLHYYITEYIPDSVPYYVILNPEYITTLKDGCPFFKSNTKTRYARGITNLFINLPLGKARRLRKRIISGLESNTFYRIRKKVRLIAPSEQNFIKRLFVEEGIDEDPVFDEYIDKYKW